MPQRGVKLDHCVIHVSDWDRSNRFYRDVPIPGTGTPQRVLPRSRRQLARVHLVRPLRERWRGRYRLVIFAASNSLATMR